MDWDPSVVNLKVPGECFSTIQSSQLVWQIGSQNHRDSIQVCRKRPYGWTWNPWKGNHRHLRLKLEDRFSTLSFEMGQKTCQVRFPYLLRGYRDSLFETVREAPTIWYQGVPRWAQWTWHHKHSLSVCIGFRTEPIWAPSQLSVCSHTPIVHSTTFSRFPHKFFRMWPHIFCQHTIHQVIWPKSRYPPCFCTIIYVRARGHCESSRRSARR